MVGTSIDPHIGRVLQLLPAGIDVVRLDVDQYPSSSSISIYHQDSEVGVAVGRREIASPAGESRVGWFRRLGAPGVSERLDERYKRFAVAEANHALESALSLLNPGVWINEYWRCRRAVMKPLQYRTAGELGIKTADTLITNSSEAAAAWLAARPRAVSKTLSSPIVFDDGANRGFSFTHVIDETDRRNLHAVDFTATQFQSLIEPAFELRVTSIGYRHIAVRIDSHVLTSRGIRDWRSDRVRCTYSWFELPASVGHDLTLLLDALGLQYAATDFIVTESGEYYFLESNPHGAWLWLEDELSDTRITKAFADYLLESCLRNA